MEFPNLLNRINFNRWSCLYLQFYVQTPDFHLWNSCTFYTFFRWTYFFIQNYSKIFKKYYSFNWKFQKILYCFYKSCVLWPSYELFTNLWNFNCFFNHNLVVLRRFYQELSQIKRKNKLKKDSKHSNLIYILTPFKHWIIKLKKYLKS